MDDAKLADAMFKRPESSPELQRPKPEWSEVHRELGRKQRPRRPHLHEARRTEELSFQLGVVHGLGGGPAHARHRGVRQVAIDRHPRNPEGMGGLAGAQPLPEAEAEDFFDLAHGGSLSRHGVSWNVVNDVVPGRMPSSFRPPSRPLLATPSRGGPFRPECPAHLLRNGWPICSGIRST